MQYIVCLRGITVTMRKFSVAGRLAEMGTGKETV